MRLLTLPICSSQSPLIPLNCCCRRHPSSLSHCNLPFKPKHHFSKFQLCAQNSNGSHNNNNDDLSKEAKGEEQKSNNNGFNREEETETKKDRRPIFNFRWVDLLDPDPDNLFAIGLTGLLTWASVQVLLQLFVISVAIIVAAVKYSFIAAILIFILIALL